MTITISTFVADALLTVLVVLTVVALAAIVGLLTGRIQIHVEQEPVETIATTVEVVEEARRDG